MYDLLFFGIQGSGKGTQAARVADHFNLVIFEMGAVLRSLAREDSELGRKVGDIMARGELVSDDVVMEIAEDFLNKTSQETHILFDGIPRTVKQASMLSSLLREKDRTEIGVFIDLSEKAALERLLLRKRGDDTSESIKKRFANYYESTLPVINQFKESGRFVHINGDQTIDEVTSSIIDAVTHYE